MSQKLIGRTQAVVVLVLLAAVIATLLAGMEFMTREQIRANQAELVRRSLEELLPAQNSFDNAPQLDVIQLHTAGALGSDEALPAWRARKAGQPVAVILTVIAADGYVDHIRLLVGISAQGQLLGVRVASHRETPGLGDAIEKSRSDWILGFNDRRLDDGTRWGIKRDGGDFDAITGATITSRAVVNAVRAALEYFSLHQASIFSIADVSVGQQNADNLTTRSDHHRQAALSKP